MSEPRTVDNALSVERLEDLRPPWDEHFDGTWRSEVWYNEAPITAASLFISAAQEDSKFREEFINDKKVEVQVFPEGDGDSTVESEKWRQTLQEELPAYHNKLDNIGLSAFQGGSAEAMARDRLK